MIWRCSWNGTGVSLTSKSWSFIQFMVASAKIFVVLFRHEVHHFEICTWWQRFKKIRLFFLFSVETLQTLIPTGIKVNYFLILFFFSPHKLLNEEQVQVSFSFWLPSWTRVQNSYCFLRGPFQELRILKLWKVFKCGLFYPNLTQQSVSRSVKVTHY